VPLSAVYIDGGYLTNVLRALGKPRIDYAQFAAWCAQGFEVFRVYYYDCLPYQGPMPSWSCPGCNARLVYRKGLSIQESSILDQECEFCGYEIAGAWD